MPRGKKADKTKKRVEAVQDVQQDHEQFLLAFEKPTQIYRFLRARQILAPTFTHRTLLYMRERCSRTNARRKKFAVKDLLSIAQACNSALDRGSERNIEDLHVAVTGLILDPTKRDSLFRGSKNVRRVDIEVLLVRTLLNKRKDLDFPVKETSFGVVDVPINPKFHPEDTSFIDHEDATILIPAAEFVKNSAADGNTKSFTLKLCIREVSSDSEESDDSDSVSDMESDDQDIETSRPRKKRKREGEDEAEEEEEDPAGISLKNLTSGPRKRSSRYIKRKHGKQEKDGPETNTRSRDAKAEQAKPDAKQKVYRSRNFKPPAVKKNGNATGKLISEIELLLFNSEFECQADSGNYELVVNKKDTEYVDYKRKAVWESFDGGKEVKIYGSFNAATLQLSLKWCQNRDLGPLADACSDHEKDEDDELRSETLGRCTRTTLLTARRNLSNGDGNNHSFLTPADLVEYRKRKLNSNDITHPYAITNGVDNIPFSNHVFYQFMYNNNTQQQTESRDDFCCPWCQLNCMTLYGLMKHLKLCHPRFLFRYSQQGKGTVIIVTVNECYDGSYAGNPHNIFCQPGMAFSRRGPVRRIPVTDILVYMPQRKQMDPDCTLAELLDKEDVEALEPTQLSTGHRRLYFHSLTSQPIRPCEFDIDSEEEATEPDWLFDHTKRMINDFTDVNEGEKALMKLWNLHVMRNTCISDAQMEDECKNFIDENVSHLARHSLRKNLLLHFACLVDFGVFKTSKMLTLMDYFDKVHKKYLNEHSEATEVSVKVTSPDFPEPDLLPCIKKLQEIIDKSSSN